MAGRFVATPEIPAAVGGLLDWQAVLFSAIKENVELVTGTRGEGDLASRAIVRGDFTVKQVGTQVMHTIATISPQGFTVGSDEVASLASHRALREDVQSLADDLVITRRMFDLLIRNLTGA